MEEHVGISSMMNMLPYLMTRANPWLWLLIMFYFVPVFIGYKLAGLYLAKRDSAWLKVGIVIISVSALAIWTLFCIWLAMEISKTTEVRFN